MLNRKRNSDTEDYSHYSDNDNVDYNEEEIDLANTEGDFNPLSQHAINNLSICSASPTNHSVASDSNKVTILLDNYVPLSYPKLDFGKARLEIDVGYNILVIHVG